MHRWQKGCHKLWERKIERRSDKWLFLHLSTCYPDFHKKPVQTKVQWNNLDQHGICLELPGPGFSAYIDHIPTRIYNLSRSISGYQIFNKKIKLTYFEAGQALFWRWQIADATSSAKMISMILGHHLATPSRQPLGSSNVWQKLVTISDWWS